MFLNIPTVTSVTITVFLTLPSLKGGKHANCPSLQLTSKYHISTVKSADRLISFNTADNNKEIISKILKKKNSGIFMVAGGGGAGCFNHPKI